MLRTRSSCFIRAAIKKKPSLLWKVPVVGGTSALLGWSWFVGMSPTHVIEQSFRSLSTLYAVSTIALDYKWTLRNSPDFEQMEKEAKSPEDHAHVQLLEKEWENRWNGIHERGAKRLLWVCQRNAGIFTKGGQHLASLNHILPSEYTKTLSVLQDKAPFVPYEEIKQVFSNDLQLDPMEIFASFDKIPIAAASLAQVHRATLHSGEKVAVKVQYPKLSRMVEGDMKTIEIVVKMISFLFPSFDFEWILPEFEENILKELDFRIECENSERADALFKENGTKGIYIPPVFHDVSSKRILVMEFIDGVKVTDIKGLKELGLDTKDVTNKIMALFSDQIFVHGFVHCDPHPGNILVRNCGGKPEIVLLDHGLYRELKDEFRLNYCHLWKAIVLRDTANVEKYSRSIGAGEFAGLFSMMLTFKPPSSLKNFDLDGEVTKEDLMEIAQLLHCSQSQFSEMLKNMDRDLMFVLRTTYLVQSINVELGGEVNRFNIMARKSITGSNRMELQESKGISSVVGRLKFWADKILFEINLAIANGLFSLFFNQRNK